MQLETITRPERRIAARATQPEADRIHVALFDAGPRAPGALERDLRRRGFEVVQHPLDDAGSATPSDGRAEVALLDLRSDGDDGFDLVRRLRAQGRLAVMVLLDGEDDLDEILCLRMGADAVLRRPWSPQLLAERLRALARRGRDLAGRSRNLLSCPPLEIDIDRMVALWRGTPLSLTATEFRLLHALAERPGYVRTRDFLMDRLYGGDIFVLDRTVDSHVKRLRRKLRDIDPGFDAIETLYGTGYRMTLPGQIVAA